MKTYKELAYKPEAYEAIIKYIEENKKDQSNLVFFDTMNLVIFLKEKLEFKNIVDNKNLVSEVTFNYINNN